MKILSRGLGAACVATALLCASASAATITVRVEGAQRTLLPSTQVTIPDGGQIPNVEQNCEWNEPAGPLEAGTNGSWDRKSFVQQILGEAYGVSDDKGWYGWVNGKYGGGICNDKVKDGDEVLFTASRFDSDYNPQDLPIYVRDVPTRASRGQAFTVTVLRSVPQKGSSGYLDPGTGELQPAQGAVVRAGGASATAGADGRATLAVNDTGQLFVQATNGPGAERSALVPVCVDCDPSTPVAGESAGAGGARCVTSGTDGLCGSIDRQAPQSLITGVREGQTFAAGRGPRELAGRVGVLQAFSPRAADAAALKPDPSGLHMVKLRLTRNDAGRCATWSGSRERFVKRACGARHGWWFGIGDKADWSYLLPSRLPRGRYVLDVNAIDKAYNRDDKRRRGENRVVFRVR